MFLGIKGQQQVETYLRPQYSEQISKIREIPNGNNRDCKDLPPASRVDNVHRLQGRLLPHSNTDPVQEIPTFSCSRSILPIQSIVHNTHGIHGGKGGQTDGFTQGYKNPPVPTGLVGQSQN